MTGHWYDKLPHKYLGRGGTDTRFLEIDGVLFSIENVSRIQRAWEKLKPEDIPLQLALLAPSEYSQDVCLRKALSLELLSQGELTP